MLGCIVSPLVGGGQEPQRAEFEAIADRLIRSDNPYLGTAQVEKARAQLDADLSVPEKVEALAKLALELIRVGDNHEAAERIDQALALARETGSVPADLHRLRARVYLRLAEVENCVAHHNAECCIFPLAGGGVHTRREPALQAKQSLLDYLGLRRTVHAGWLLNLTAMALGEYPEGIPAHLRIPLDRFESDYQIKRFRDIAPRLGLDDLTLCGGTIVQDFDNDGFLDIVVSSYDPLVPLAFYRNAGDGTFENRSSVSRLDDQLGGLNLIGGDYDNDGDVDLQHPYLPMGANFGDFDHDGWLDIYLGTGDPGYDTLMPNVMLRNDRGRVFQDVTVSGGFGHLQKGHGIAFADLDNDGDQDIFHQLGGFYPGDKFKNALFENPGNDSRFIYVNLAGRETNRAGFGVRLTLTLETSGGTRTIHRAVGSVSSFSGSPFRQEIGLGNATAMISLKVFWPGSGTTQTFTDLPLDSSIRVTEGVDTYEQLPLKEFEFAKTQ